MCFQRSMTNDLFSGSLKVEYVVLGKVGGEMAVCDSTSHTSPFHSLWAPTVACLVSRPGGPGGC